MSVFWMYGLTGKKDSIMLWPAWTRDRRNRRCSIVSANWIIPFRPKSPRLDKHKTNCHGSAISSVRRNTWWFAMRITPISASCVPTDKEPRLHTILLTSRTSSKSFYPNNLAIAVELSGDQVDAVRRALIEGLTREGFSIAGPTFRGRDNPSRETEGGVDGDRYCASLAVRCARSAI